MRPLKLAIVPIKLAGLQGVIMKLYGLALISTLFLSTGAYALSDQALYNTNEKATTKTQKKKVVNNHEVIKEVQIQLNDRGYSVGEIDGVYGPHTRDMLKSFQQNTGLSVTGAINAETLEALDIIYVTPAQRRNQSYSE